MSKLQSGVVTLDHEAWTYQGKPGTPTVFFTFALYINPKKMSFSWVSIYTHMFLI